MGIAGEVQARYSESRQVSLWLFGTGTISTCTATEHFSANYIAPRLDFDALLCERALRAGASWLDQVTVHALAEEQPQGVIAHMQQLRAHHPDLAQALGAFLQSPAASLRGNSGRLPSGQACAARRSTATTCSAWVTLRRSCIP